MPTNDTEQETTQQQMSRSNEELWQEWAIDVDADPHSIPLSKLNPAHPSLFEANTMQGYFERLRSEAPVHRCEESQFGPYWSITRYDDIRHVDSS
ncbi:MAG: hypothetical protein ACC642_04975, partial [Pseudomonadales bacterium]